MTTNWDVEKAAPKICRVECFVKRDRKNSVFYLYLETPPDLVQDKGQLLLAAKQFNNGDTKIRYIISRSADDFSEESPSYIGEVLQSNYVGTKFTVLTRQLPPSSTSVVLAEPSQREVDITPVSPENPPGLKTMPTETPPIGHNIVRLAHEFNFFCINVCGKEIFAPRVLKILQNAPAIRTTPAKGAKESTHMRKSSLNGLANDPLRQKLKEPVPVIDSDLEPKTARPLTKTPFPLKRVAQIVYQANFCGLCRCQRDFYGRRLPKQMECTLSSVPIAATDGEGSGPSSSVSTPKAPKSVRFRDDIASIGAVASPVDNNISTLTDSSIIIRTKSPKWLEKEQNLCLIFQGRATIDSTKNFQLAIVATAQAIPEFDTEQVVLQFGKIGTNKFTVDYRYPLSAFLAFAVCLSTFDSKF
ncbi:hypothetical protein O6H91_21G028200 [Diphasiastrum complanatum]|uniref:Uncharacterized protein n=1 Tax=Diphasiastrum complanatum TaxID=34168 RepID=A0ACC2AJ41_DIPCM|nr:hypothetical protein O6H91_21G028200 [Diphasiastrum complanatum]